MKHYGSVSCYHAWVIFFVFCSLVLQCIVADDEEHDGFASFMADDLVEHLCEEPPPPRNGELTCGKHKKKANKYVCKVECDAGYQFPKKKKKLRHICDLDTGVWNDYFFPDCEPICNPPCKNDGRCTEGNHCICTPKYRGDRCQYGIDLCEPESGLHVSADWTCNHTTEQTACVMNCPQGTRYESPPADIYHCSLDGTWTPSFAPKCVPINVIEPPAANGMYPVTINQMLNSNLPNSGVCALWGTSHIRTFDGGIYSFQGSCTYLLSKDCEQNSFAIHVHNPTPCETVSSCSTSLAIYIGSEKYLLTNSQEGGPIVEHAGETHVIPAALNGLLFQVLSDYVTVSSSLGFRLKWNRKNTVLLKATSQLQNRTCGLCGKFDGSVLNDFETSDGSITDNVEGFVNSWTMEDLGENCEQKVVVKDSCSENKDKVSEAEKLCNAIFDKKFALCHEIVDPKIYFQVCKMDHCACPSGSCYCGTLAEYFRECTRLGGKLDGGWRSSELCPLSCPEGMIYKDCGTSCPTTCKGTVYNCEEHHCVDGCHCPDGMVLHDGRCVEKRSCPCMHNGKEHPNGARLLADCNACECNAGEWECTKEKCEARCTSAGDPHYTTFDGLSYEFYGSCSYYLVYNEQFKIIQETGPCPASSGSEPATEGMFCTNQIEVKYLDEVLVLQPGIKVIFNEKSADMPIFSTGMTVSMATDLFLKVNLANGVNVLWDGQNRIYIDAPPSLFDQTKGLCGTFNKNMNDDFLTPSNDTEVDVSSFAERWRVSDSCHKRTRRSSTREPCESQPQKLRDAELLCSFLKEDTFTECHAKLDLKPYYKGCVYDLCLCTNDDLTECLCPILADFGMACTTKGVIVNWVDQKTACKPECSGGQIYRECGNPCTSSCAAIASSNMCTQQCVQGCTCAEGMALNNEGFCVSVDQCPCIYENKEYLPASVILQGSNVCTCQAAKWQCRPGTLTEIASLNSDFMIDDGTVKCLHGNNEEYTSCREECPRTCQNIHLPIECKTEECKPGCRCKEGFLFDSEKNKCVKESECGCIHGRRRFKEGETIRQSCNLCTCFDGVWQCPEKECPGVCSVWGESHFKTFDGKIFDFSGECEYVLSKGKTKGASYSISVQNVPCGSSGVTCSKSFTLDLGPMKTSRGDVNAIAAEAETLTLTKGEPLPKTTYRSRFVIIEAGLFVMVYTDIGLSLQWDRGTRIYVTIEPRWRERVNGLCGNFNDDQGDDFLTPSGGIPEVSSSVFAESWKVQEFCPQSQNAEDACEIHSYRKSWAQQKCGILKSEAFTACHSEVAMEPYYERCVFDTCACDMGGDCECLCTAIAAYAQECNMHGVSVKWRSQELCPIQCEECANYESCIPSCPKKTCENEIYYSKIERACTSDFCVEGCDPKPCPSGQIYNNGREYKCIPEIECVVPCMELNGKIYNEGERITDVQVVDGCQTCHCLKGSVSCTGPPCADIEPMKECLQTGWTPWLNTPAFVGGDFEVLTDPRLRATLENHCGIANMTEIDCRVVDTKQPYTETGQRVSCKLPLGLSCKDEEQKDSVCQDYEIRVYCDCGPIPTTEVFTRIVTEEIPTAPAPVCVTGWTEYFNTDHPDASDTGDDESLDRLKARHDICIGGTIEDIECKALVNGELVDYKELDTFGLKCSKNTGFVCNKYVRTGKCEDFAVRFFCACEEMPQVYTERITTAIAEMTTTPIPLAPVPVECGWTPWLNVGSPDSEVGDTEDITKIQLIYKTCGGKDLIDIECRVARTLQKYSESRQNDLICNTKQGFECLHEAQVGKCYDYEVRLLCMYSWCYPPTAPPVPIVPTTEIIPQDILKEDCWTEWINLDNPFQGGGDLETQSEIRRMFSFCEDPVKIECRTAVSHQKPQDVGQNVVCDVNEGLICWNKDNKPEACYDYEIRFFCPCLTTPPVPTAPQVPIAPTPENPCNGGKVYDPCAFHCGQLCSSLAYKLSEECQNAPDGCIAGCIPAEGCEPPNMWRDYYTCVSKENCMCAMEGVNGTVTNLAPNEVIELGCEKCQCIENGIFCHRRQGCGTTERTSRLLTTPPVPIVPSTEIIPENIPMKDCWTEWINLDNPFQGGGDFETQSKIRRTFIFCEDPVKIECRTAVSHQKPQDVGQNVVCDLNKGLICWNKDNKPEACYDYEIRFFCPCPIQMPTTTTPIPTLEPGPCLYGYTEWFNSHYPESRGEYETVQSARIFNSFCSNDMISALECRQVGKPAGVLQHGVICDLDIGLKCNPEFLYGDEQCSDYEVRFFCDCPTMTPITETQTLPTLVTTEPTACSHWSEWFNENHPGSGGGVKKGGVKGGGVNTGDNEKVTLLKLKREYGFCKDGQISKIECREASTDLDYTKTGDRKLVCNTISGFRCRGKDQQNYKCKDYKIRYFCTCYELTPVPTNPTVPPIAVPPCTTHFYNVVDGPSPLPDTSLRASTSRDSSSGPQSARLNSVSGAKSAGAWIAGETNGLQFIEINLGRKQPIYGVVTKGRSGHMEWVKSYKVLYSRDGTVYSFVKDPEAPNEEKVFSGNYDSESEVRHVFKKPIETRFIRIQPITFHKAISMRVDVLGCSASGMNFVQTTTIAPAPTCTDEMGMYSGAILDNQITTSSDRNPNSDGRYARLNTPQTEEHAGGWVAGELDNKQFIQVDFLEPRNITGLKTQGRDMVSQWVTAFYITYSQDGEKWNVLKDDHGTIIFPGNSDSSTTATTYFDLPIRARFLRIHPQFWENWIAMRFEVLGCTEEILPSPGTTPRILFPGEECNEPMGFENHALPDTLISVSSSSTPNTGASRIRLNTHADDTFSGGWIAYKDDYMPRVYVDFYEERNLTGIMTQGLEDADLWVMTYKVAYSLDNQTWDFVRDMETGDSVFPGNFDRNSIVMRLFDRMIAARFLEIVILDYHTRPAMRMEILGCFVPYTVYTPRPLLPTTTEICVEYGRWISLSDPASSDFGDEEPINEIISASAVCRNPFEIECRTQVTKKDSSQVGQSVTCDLTHGLLCMNSDQMSNQCYNYEVRIKCWTCGGPETTTLRPLEMCPEIPDTFRDSCPESCPSGFACDGTACVPSTDCPCFQNGKRFEPSNIVITKDCNKCECILGGHSRCEQIKCPDCLPGQKSEMDFSCHCGCVGCAEGTLLCPTSGECIKEEQWCNGVVDCPDDETGCPTTTTLAPTTTPLLTTTELPESDNLPRICSTDYFPDTDTCEMMANMFETFDGLTYQYDICNHVLMKESGSELYSVTVHKTCISDGLNFCYRYLVIEVDGVVIKLGPGLEDITLRDIRIPVANLWLVSKRFQDFELKKVGNTLVFRSFKYNFDVIWDSLEDARITVSKCLVDNIVGLCGFYNEELRDDLTMPNGRLAPGNEDFGDSWAIGSLEKCKPPTCSSDTMRTAIEICNDLRGEPFNSSCSEYLNMESRVEACIVYMCECMRWPTKDTVQESRSSKDVMYDLFEEESCKCQAYERFAEACENVKQGPLQEWRIRHGCAPKCPPGMEWQDCGPGCELTCDNYQESTEICSTTCVHGCYCPPGLVRHHNRCVKPQMCQDCVCRGHGDPNYITFDGRFYSFQGNCTYILAQHQTSDDERLNFRILATNVECPEEPGTSCTHGLTIYWKEHVIEKFMNKPVYLDEKPLSPEDSPLDYKGISISFVPNKSTVIHIKEINLAVRYFDQMYGFNIELPAILYYNKTEGLCGVCNFIQSDDLYHRDGYVTEDIEDFAYSWLEEQQTRKNCEFPRERIPEPPPDICNFTINACDVFLDPKLYSKSCQNDVTYSRKPETSVCRSQFQYAQQCCERGVSLVEWLQLSGCENSCPEGMIYECTSACPKTCDNYKNYQEDDCSLMPLYTCVCPEGKVLKLGKCVPIIQCEVCDVEGHTVGDIWQEGPCKRCECLSDRSLSCTITECPEPPVCDVKETMYKLNRTADACCEAYQCMPYVAVCPETSLDDCPPGQAYVKDYKDGCPVYRCECIPDMCPPPVIPLLDEGENFTLVTKDCCMDFEVSCDLQSCAPPPKCNVGFKPSTYQGKCCEKYTCVPKKNICVYQHKHEVVNGTQVELPLEEYYEQEYEPGSSWQDGLCRKCSCIEYDGQFVFNCREEICPDPKDFPDADKYYREEIHVPGACCPKYHRTACVIQGTKYEIDEEWPSPEGDPCKSYSCVLDQKGEAVRLEKTTICDRMCPAYAEYVGAEPGSGKCCGVCMPVACEEDGNLYKNGETWVSTAKPCYTAECQVSENGSRIVYRGESCPIMPDNCPPEQVKTDPKGCCTYCKRPTTICSAVEVPVYETRGFFGYIDKHRGLCSNEQVLHSLTKCGGQCEAESHYSNLMGDFQSVCSCCLPMESQNRTISLDCEDGSKVQKVYMQPITCQCLSCSGSSRTLDALNQVEPYKK